MSGDDAWPTLPPLVESELAGTGDLISSWWTVAVLAVLTATLAVLVVRRGRRERRRWPVVVPAVLTGVLTVAVAANTWVGYFPSLGSLRQWAAANLGIGDTADQARHPIGGERFGGIDAVTIPVPADVRAPTSTTWIYTPPGYDESADPQDQADSYPVLVLAHGSPGTATDWFAAGDAPHVLDVLIDNGVIDPVIAVAFDMNGTGPGANDTQCLDSTTGGSSISTYLEDVVLPWVGEHYATDGTHLIAGFSAGAFCALDQGLRHPETYDGIVAIAPYLDPGSGGRAMLASDAERAEHDLRHYVPDLAPDDAPVAFVMLERSASERADLEAMATLLRERDHPVLLHEVDADHTWAATRSVFPQALTWVARQAGLAPVASDP